MPEWRFWLAFAVLALWEFGLIGYGVVLLIRDRPGAAFLTIVLVMVSGRILPRPIAWLTLLGRRSSPQH